MAFLYLVALVNERFFILIESNLSSFNFILTDIQEMIIYHQSSKDIYPDDPPPSEFVLGEMRVQKTLTVF